MRNYNQEIIERLGNSIANLFISIDEQGLISIYHLGSIEQKIILLKYLEKDIDKAINELERVHKTPPLYEDRGN